MIAKNYIQHPDALRFQRELFAAGPKNTVLSRLTSVICNWWKKEIPQWWKDLKAAEMLLIKSWKKAMFELFKKAGKVQIKKNKSTCF